MSSFADAGSEHLHADTWTSAAGKPEVLASRLGELIRSDYRAVVAASLDETAHTIQKNLQSLGLRFPIEEEAPPPTLHPAAAIVVAELSRGFVLPWARLALVAESDLTGRRSGAHRRRVAARKRQPTGPLDLADGDLVVHEVHGIGRYMGMVERELLGVHREYLILEYAKGDRLYVPSDQVDLVSKYVGGEAPKVNRLGSSEWVEDQVPRSSPGAREIAHELVNLYSERLRAKGYVYGPDTPWQRELEDQFPYEETPDQLRAIDDVKDDMESDKPMDRLVCADVGYGKTEIAVRAAFKAVAAGKQVAVLVPTTILAQQHHATFAERFHHFPVRVEMLSRFLSASEAKRVIADVAEGKVDVVIGTHRLLGNDVKFNDLGLVIVDEEQRFGVDQKEKLKKLRGERGHPDPDRDTDPAHDGDGDVGHPRHLDRRHAPGGPTPRHHLRGGVRGGRHPVGDPPRAAARWTGLLRPPTCQHDRSLGSHRPGACSGSARWGCSRTDGRARARTGDARLRRQEDERPGLHDDHRIGTGHAHCEHFDRRTLRPSRSFSDVPAARSSRSCARARCTHTSSSRQNGR